MICFLTSIAGLNVPSNNGQRKLLAQDSLGRIGDFHINILFYTSDYIRKQIVWYQQLLVLADD
ncbi:MAG TPA: hypothetical protein ENI41_07755 [Deltaproteobacteria bacterium]|nr:hypothetical protein [Deltaproteobacteria bacterium]